MRMMDRFDASHAGVFSLAATTMANAHRGDAGVLLETPEPEIPPGSPPESPPQEAPPDIPPSGPVEYPDTPSEPDIPAETPVESPPPPGG